MKTIRELRLKHGWTQFELAVMVGVQPQAVYFWESGRRTPQVAQLRRLGEIFGMCSDDIELRTTSRTGHRARADRRQGESMPGRDRTGRATVRGEASLPVADQES